MRDLIFRLLTATWLAFLIAPTRGAEIRQIVYPSYDVILEGKIEAGDYDKLLKFIAERCGNPDRCPSQIFLASPGGDLIEAMKIGRLVRTLRVETKIPSDLPSDYRKKTEAILKLNDSRANYMCTSACFFVFVAGINRERDIFPAILGIHRPYLSEQDLRRLSGSQVIDSAEKIRTTVETYLKEMGVLTKYTDLMFSIPKNQVRLVEDADFESDFEGWIPELRDWLEAKCNNLTDVEKVVSKGIELKKKRGEKLTLDDERMNRILGEKNWQQGQCQSQVLSKLRADAWQQFRGK